MNISELKTSVTGMKKEIERDMLLQRYQNWLDGRPTVEEQFRQYLSKAKAYISMYWRVIIKRALDLTISVVGVILAAPLMLAIAAVVKVTSKGPVIYKQTRTGRYGKSFEIMKFRTMRIDAETSTGPVWAKENDPRVTPVGAFLRTTHLDELPQFFNVLKGEMSIVGPRPERPHFVNEFKKTIPDYEKRLFAKPGITGLAQMKRNYDESLADVKKKLRYDVLYIRKMCPLLDVKLIVMTFAAVILRTGR